LIYPRRTCDFRPCMLCRYQPFPQQTNRMIVCRTAVFVGELLSVS
jgi:hypothetical protein